MKAQALVTRDQGETARDTLKKLMEECEMKATNAITTVNNWLSHSWVRKTPGKLLAALAVGGLIMAAAVVTPSSAFADEPSRPLSATEPGALLTLEDYFAAASSSLPASEAYQSFALWEFPDMNRVITKDKSVSGSMGPSEAYQAFTLWEFPDMNHESMGRKSALDSVPATEAYNAFADWEFQAFRLEP